MKLYKNITISFEFFNLPDTMGPQGNQLDIIEALGLVICLNNIKELAT